MSLEGLISGADCAVQSNPLSQVLKHAEGDRSLQQDRIAGPSSSRLHHLPSSVSRTAAEHDMAMARQFFDGNHRPAVVAPSFAPGTYNIPSDLAFTQGNPSAANFGDAWARVQQQYSQALPQPAPSAAWANEFKPAQTSLNESATKLDISQTNLARSPYMSPGMYGNIGPGVSSMYGNSLSPFRSLEQPVVEQQGKGKGKMREEDFEAAFAQFTASMDNASLQSARVEELDDLGEKLAESSLDDGVTDFKQVWDQLQNSDMPPPAGDMAKWEAEFNQMMSAQREDDYDYGAAMQNAWADYEDGITNEDGRVKFDDDGLPILAPYTFEPNNKYLDPSTSTSGSRLADAKALLEQNGSLSEAALLLEAAIQMGDLGEGGYEAWILLGETRNMDEREDAGMKALVEGVKRAERAGATGDGMLSLAISFTNESYDRAAHSTLLRWLRARFPTYPLSPETEASIQKSAWHSNEAVTAAFLDVARAQHEAGTLDPDVQIALGVLSYTQGNYERARDCFESALSIRPKDYLLWNRLGSCLSNGNKPEESLGAYREALSLRPTYTRAIYNVGVACLNIGAHREAAEHFLSALAMQETTGEKSEQLWITLRRAFAAMERPDLADMTKNNPSLDIFRKEGFDF